MRREHAARERLKRDGVAGIAHDSQGGDHVLDDVVLDQRAATRQPAGNPRADETSLEVLADFVAAVRSEEHTSELQSRLHLVCRLLLEKKKTNEKNAEKHKSEMEFREHTTCNA